MRKLDRQVAARIVKTLEERIAPLDDPRSTGSALAGDHAGYWRWRIGRIVRGISAFYPTVCIQRF